MRSERRKKSGAGKYVLLIILLLIILAVTTSVLYLQNLGEPYKRDTDKYVQVEIPEGTPASGVASILEKKGVIRFAPEFILYSRLKMHSKNFQAGTYALSAGMTMKKIAKIITSGEVSDIEVAIPEGYTQDDIVKAFTDKGAANSKKLRKSLRSKSFKKEYAFLKAPEDGDHYMEGYLAPKTYLVKSGTSSDDIVRMMLNAHALEFTDGMKKQAKMMKLTEHDIMIIASIIEKECADTGDQKIVASVIYNRLKEGMPLQMDSTIQYILGLEGKRKDDLLNKDTQIESPYNTYLNAGLPVGPICSPGISAINAALHPAKTKYMYFVLSAKLDNKMAFSVDYDDFLKDKDAYYKALEEQREAS